MKTTALWCARHAAAFNGVDPARATMVLAVAFTEDPRVRREVEAIERELGVRVEHAIAVITERHAPICCFVDAATLGKVHVFARAATS